MTEFLRRAAFNADFIARMTLAATRDCLALLLSPITARLERLDEEWASALGGEDE